MKKPSKLKPSVEAASAELANSLAGIGSNDNDIGRAKLTILPTFSSVDRYLSCAWPWGREIPIRVGVGSPASVEARFGLASHEGFALLQEKQRPRWKSIAKKFAVDGDVDANDVKTRATSAFACLQTFLRGDNPWRMNFMKWKREVESPFAYKPYTWTARRCDPPNSLHVYEDRQEGEINGTLDHVGVGKIDGRGCVLVLDLKTGFDIGSVRTSGQLLSGALATSKFFGVPDAIIGFIHAPGYIPPTIYAEHLFEAELNAFGVMLQDAGDRPNESLTPSESNCHFCPMKHVACPVHAGALAEIQNDIGGGLIHEGAFSLANATAEQVGDAHEKLKQLTKKFAEAAGQVDAEIRAWVSKNGAAVRRNGQEVDFVERGYTELSMKSIKEALGEMAGAMEIERLRKKGCVRTGTRKELRVK